MLELRRIAKSYKFGNNVQNVLKDINLKFRDSEFISILGPSGSGKTTLLNIIGGLLSYDEGDLIINNVSTREYKDRDWDSYRNHSVGFVFQNYNLIPHQTVLQNVMLSLIISGEKGSKVKEKAKRALEKVGLSEHINKKPNQLSGGQMQRVSIARAIVNDPDIILADEPTGALDTKTSEQIMKILKEISEDRLVIMVTHNPELSETYSNRIINLRDGKIEGDTNPLEEIKESNYSEEEISDKKKTKKAKKTSMSFFTSIKLSFNNLKTKKGRTILTAFAGSIGIIGISTVLALSNGINTYITSMQKDTMKSYPIAINKKTVDFNGMIKKANELRKNKKKAKDGIYVSNVDMTDIRSQTNITTNDLKSLKKYLDNKDNKINKYIGKRGVVYNYNTSFDAWSYSKDDILVKTDAKVVLKKENADVPSNFNTSRKGMGTLGGEGKETAENFSEIMSEKGNMVSSVVKENYKLLKGKYPSEYNEVLLVLQDDSSIAPKALYQLGFISKDKYKEIVSKGKENKKASFEKILDYKDVLNHTFYVVPKALQFEKGQKNFYSLKPSNLIDKAFLDKNAIKVNIVGIVKEKDNAKNSSLSTPIAYTHKLTKKIAQVTDESEAVKEQEQNKNINIFTGKEFNKDFTYNDVMDSLGSVDLSSPDSISIYTDKFEDKENVDKEIKAYNKRVKSNQKISYTDYVKFMTQTFTKIVSVISMVLIAFVAVALFVSCIMIGIITHISVMERTKEIGILRAIGASKKNIKNVFNAETIIIGILAGAIGVFISYLLTFPINTAVRHAVDSHITTYIKFVPSLMLILLSVFINFIGGFLPARSAAKKDPVDALRTE